jgi:predicted SprT family Zn-dependent metalloprotease
MRAPSLQKQIVTLVNHWRPIMGLDTWIIQVRFDEKVHTATCIAQPQYEEAMLTFNPKRIRTTCPTPGMIEELVVHELTHALSWKSNERTVTRISRALLRAAGRPIS